MRAGTKLTALRWPPISPQSKWTLRSKVTSVGGTSGPRFLSPWGFDVSSITVPVQLWHGEDDVAAPLAHGRWLAAHIPGVEAIFVPGADHTNIETRAAPHAYRWISGQF